MAFTVREQLIITKSRALMPEMFQGNVTDEKILAFAEVIVADINVFPPLGGYTTENLPGNVLPVLYFGVTVFSELFLQMNATLQDFDYNDNGLSVRVNQVEKINTSYQNMLKIYKDMIINFKKTEILRIGGKGLGTPRFQSQIGQFLKVALGSSFNWNTTS
jgi:hypothetical protein